MNKRRVEELESQKSVLYRQLTFGRGALSIEERQKIKDMIASMNAEIAYLTSGRGDEEAEGAMTRRGPQTV